MNLPSNEVRRAVTVPPSQDDGSRPNHWVMYDKTAVVITNPRRTDTVTPTPSAPSSPNQLLRIRLHNTGEIIWESDHAQLP